MSGVKLAFGVAAAAIIGGAVLSPAYLVHGNSALVCSLVGCEPTIKGLCDKEFGLVKQIFEDNFKRRGEHGAAAAVYFRGELVADLWGGEWSQSHTKQLRSFGGAGGLIVALLMERGQLDASLPVSSVWPGFRQWATSDVSISEVIQMRFNASLLAPSDSTENRRVTSAKILRITPNRETPTPLEEVNENATLSTLYGYNPFIRDVVLTAIVPLVDPKKRDFVTYFKEEIASKVGLSEAEFQIGWRKEGTQGVKDFALVDKLALSMRALGNVTDGWCGPLPTRELWTQYLFGDPKPGFAEYLMYGDEFFGKRVPVVSATAAGLAKLYSFVASGDEETKTDIGAVQGRSLFKTKAATSCVAQKNLNTTTPIGFDELGRNVTVSSCGFALSTDTEPLYTLKETETHGRRWMHFAWANLGGSYVAASVGHGISLAYLVCVQKVGVGNIKV